MGWTCSMQGQKKDAYSFLLGKTEAKRLERNRHTYKDNTGMNLMEIDLGSVDWNNLAQNTDRWRTYKHGHKPSSSTKFHD
jgi:hypothetical protein